MPDNTPTFSESYIALDTVLETFKQGNPSLEDALSLFESGVTHLKNCQSKLNQAKGKVEVLTESLHQDAEITIKPFLDFE